MDWMVGITLIFAIYIAFRLIRSKNTARSMQPSVPTPSTSRQVALLQRFEGVDCIYTDGALILKARVLQVEAEGGQAKISIQPLYSEGLSVSPENTIVLRAALNAIESRPNFLHGLYVNWKLFFDSDLIHHMVTIGRKGADTKILLRTLLDFSIGKDTIESLD